MLLNLRCSQAVTVNARSESMFILSIVSNKCTSWCNTQNIYWQVGLYTFALVTPRGWYLGAETCRSLCTSCVLHHEVHLLGNMSILRICTVK